MSQQLRTLSVLLFPSPHRGLSDVIRHSIWPLKPGKLSPLFFLQFSHCYFLPLCSRYWMRRSSLSTAFRFITAVCKIPRLLSPTVCCPWWPWPSITQYCLMAIPVSMSTPCICKRTYLMLVTYFFTSSLLVGFSSSGIQASVSLQFEALSSGIQSPLH